MQVITFIGLLLHAVFNRVFGGHMDNQFLVHYLNREKLSIIIYMISFKAMLVITNYLALFLFYEPIIKKFRGSNRESRVKNLYFAVFQGCSFLFLLDE